MSRPFDRPEPVDLIEAVRNHLADEVLDRLEGSSRYGLLVALRALDTAARELRRGPGAAARHGARLQRLGVPDDAGLAEDIRTGRFDHRLVELHRELTELVDDKLRVDGDG